MIPKRIFVIKAAWSATSKLIKITAKDAEQALNKAEKNKQAKGCSSLVIHSVRDR